MTRHKKRNFAVTILSILVFISTFYILIVPADSKTNAYICGNDEHIHTSECFEMCDNAEKSILVCSMQDYGEKTAHIHDSFCYDGDSLICPMEEYPHSHDESCCDENGTIICGIAVHQHSEQCFTAIGEYGSTEILVCGKNAHVHTAQCNEIVPVAVVAENSEESADYAVNEIAYSDGDFYESHNAHAPPSDDIDISGGVDMTDYITAVALRYKNDSNSWTEITAENSTNLPANREYRLDVSYSIDNIDTLKNSGNKLILKEKIPLWINPTDTNLIYNDEVAGFIAVQNGTLVITFDGIFMNNHSGSLSGSFFVYGTADWHKVNTDGEDIDLPKLEVKKLDFEDDLPEKYGKATVKKSVENNIAEYNNKYYLKYTLTVQSMEEDFDIKNITVKDKFTANGRYTGYAEINDTPTALGDSENGVTPYETRQGGAGTVALNGDIMEWNIGTLGAGEKRVLTYYAELSETYTGGEAKGTVSNHADLFSDEYLKDSTDENFTPTANLDVTKEILDTNIDETGTGTITYKVRVVSWANNSYPLKNVRINDIINPKYKNFIDGDSVDITVTYEEIENNKTVNTTETHEKLDYNAEKQLIYTIPALEAGDAVSLTYTISLKNILTAENNDIQFQNKADIYLDGNGSGSGNVFKSSFVDYTICQSSWIRKISGVSLDHEETVTITGGDVYNYGEKTKNNNPPSDFKVPKNSRQYQIIVNEGGAWNLSSATLHDNFQKMNNTDYMAYTGFVCIEEFALDETNRKAIKSENDEKAISRLTGLEPKKTVWVNIDGMADFDIKPSDYGLDEDKYTYLLTYYAQPKNIENIGTISITNEFTVYGNIGNGTVIAYPGILCSVSNTVSGAIHYNATKEAWYLTNDPTEDNTPIYSKTDYVSSNKHGALYWIIKVDGTVNEGFSIKDMIANSGYSGQQFCTDSVAGVFRGSKNIDIAGTYEKYTDLLKDGSFEKLSGNDFNLAITNDNMKLRYNKVNITDVNELDGRSFVIANMNGTYYGTMGNTLSEKGGISSDEIKLAKAQWAVNGVWNNCYIGAKSAVWTFKRTNGNKFYISSGGKYLDIKGDNNVTLSDTPVELNVAVSDNYEGQIRISNNNGYYLTWAGISEANNNRFSAWGGATTDSRQLSVMEYDYNDYLWTADSNNATITFQKDITLNDDEALYVVIRAVISTVDNKVQDKTSHKNNLYGNDFQINDVINGTIGTTSRAEYLHKLAGSILKEGKSAYSYDGTDWSVAYADGNTDRLNSVWNDSGRLKIKYNGKEISAKTYIEQEYGSGTYAEWYVTANWDGTMNGTVDMCDTLPDNFEPVCVSLYYWTNSQVKSPVYPEIPSLEYNSDWQKKTIDIIVDHGTYGSKYDKQFNYYYNPSTNEVRWRIENLVGEGDSDLTGTQNYENSLGFIVICKVKDPDILMNGTNTVAENTATIQCNGVTDSDSDVICINGGTSLKKNFELGTIVTEKNNNTFEISSAKIPFIINVNSFEEKLSKDGTLPPLIDKMSDALEIDASSIKIEYSDGNAVQGCSYVVNGQTMTFSGLPDEKAIKIFYSAKIRNLNSEDTEADVSNEVYWDGYDRPDSPQINNAHMAFKMGGEITLSEHPMITLIKTEKGDNAKFLAGAVFELLDSDKKVISTKKTDSNGRITFNKDDENKYLLDYNKIYYIKEKSAPSGYELDETEKCVVILKDTKHADYAGIGDDVLFWDAKVYDSECEYHCENEKKKIKLEKVFEGGSPIGTYSFGIYEGNNPNATPMQTLTIEYAENSEPVYRLNGVVVDKPEFTCAEAGMQYYVYELCNGKPISNGDTACINGHNFVVSYSANNNYVSLTSANITVTNRVVYYELPMTGGKGTSIFYVISIPIIAVAVILLVKKFNKKSAV